MNKNNTKAYSEVYQIVNMMEKIYLDKIPKNVIDFLDEARDLQRYTMVLLAILDLNYWCDSEEEKQELLDMFNRNTEIKIKQQKELEIKYNPDNLFKKKQTISEIEENEELSMIEYKEPNIIKRILDKILNMFKKK